MKGISIEITAVVEITQNDLDLAAIHRAINDDFQFDCHMAELVATMDPAELWKRASKRIRVLEGSD